MSVRERIYALAPEGEDSPMAGILIYTSVPDSEGTLGGLVTLGYPDSLGRHIEAALERIAICASDPYCSEHNPAHCGFKCAPFLNCRPGEAPLGLW